MSRTEVLLKTIELLLNDALQVYRLLLFRNTLELLIHGLALAVNRYLLLQRELGGYEDRLLQVAWLEELDRFFAFLSLVVEEVDGRLARELHIPAADEGDLRCRPP